MTAPDFSPPANDDTTGIHRVAAESLSIQELQRWQDFGATWRVLASTDQAATIAMCRCDGGEEVRRVTTADPELLRWLAGRSCSEDDQLAPPE
jgi:hypothetical protein